MKFFFIEKRKKKKKITYVKSQSQLLPSSYDQVGIEPEVIKAGARDLEQKECNTDEKFSSLTCQRSLVSYYSEVGG